MGYIELINRFWELDAAYAFSSYEVHFYFILLDYANKSGWKEPLYLPNSRFVVRMQCSEPTFIRVRQRVNDLGVIKYEKGTTHKAGKYFYSEDYLTTLSNRLVIVKQSLGQSLSNPLPNVGSYIRQRQDKDKDLLEINQNTDLSLPKPFSKRYPQEYQKLHKDLQGVVDLYELSVKPLEFDELPKLLNLNQQFTAGQIREAIQKFSSNSLERFKEQGLEYIVKPLNNRMFGQPKGEGSHEKRNAGSNVKQDAVKGPKFDNGPDLSSIEYK